MAIAAAIVLLDLAVLGLLTFGSGHAHFPREFNLWSGLAVGQLSLTAIWLATRRRHGLMSFVVPPIALLLASLIRLKLHFFDFSILDYAFRNTLQALVGLVPVALLVRSPLWRWIGRDGDGVRLRFSFVQMFVWTTCVALVASLFSHATWINGRPLAFLQWMGLLAPGVVAVAIVVVHQLPAPWPFRFAAHVLVGALVGYTLARLGNPYMTTTLAIEFAAQAFVVAVGVEWGRLGDVPPGDAKPQAEEATPAA